MPSGKEFSVERFVNGMRDTRFSEGFPEDLVPKQFESPDGTHTHLVFGTEEELAAVEAEFKAEEKAFKEAQKEAEAEAKEAAAAAKEAAKAEAAAAKAK